MSAQNPPAVSPEQQNLFNAIDSATPERLGMILKKLSTSSPDTFILVQQELILKPGVLKRTAPWNGPDERAADDDDDDDDDEEEDRAENSGAFDDSDYSDEGASSAGGSRQRFEVCEQCEKEYDVLQNGKKSCRWHSGEMEVDEDGDFWADHDEDCHGEIDSEWARSEYPERFKWSCCEELGDKKGCRLSRHRPNRAKRVKI